MRNFLLFASLVICSAACAENSTNAVVYPLTTCIVSGDKLGAMGAPVIINDHGTEIRFCCHDCVATFNQNPSKYLAKLKAAAQK